MYESLKQFNPIVEFMLGHENTAHYSLIEILLFAFGFIFWFLAYFHIIRDGFRYGFNEMPMIVAAGNLAWEFTWAFLFKGDLGWFFQLGCRIWFFTDLFINFQVLYMNRKYITHPIIRSNWPFYYVFFLISWFLTVFYMGETGDDNQLGVVSALLINVVMSSLYVYQIIYEPQYRERGMSHRVAWYKMLGTGVISIASFIVWRQNSFLMSMCLITFLLDSYYIYLYNTLKVPAVEEQVQEAVSYAG